MMKVKNSNDINSIGIVVEKLFSAYYSISKLRKFTQL